MRSEIATLIAASIAAVAAITSLIVNVFVATRRERRDAHRKALEAELPDLADGLHKVVAASYTQHRQLAARKERSAANWRERGHAGAQQLHKVRPRVRYALPGVDLGLRNLARLPDWVAHHGGRPTGEELLRHADALASCLHTAIEKSWRSGNAPQKTDQRKIERLVVDLRRCAPAGAREQAIAEEPVGMTASDSSPEPSDDAATGHPAAGSTS
jgi:hypothetical protein